MSSDALRAARDLCLDVLLRGLDGALTPRELASAPEALAACGRFAAAHRALDRACAALDETDALTLTTLANGALKLGRGDALLTLREAPLRHEENPLPTMLRGGRIAFSGGDPEGVAYALRSAKANGVDRIVADGLLGEALALAADAHAMGLEEGEYGAAFAARVDTCVTDLAPIASLARGLARRSLAMRDPEAANKAREAGRATLDLLKRAAPPFALAAQVCVDTHDALVALERAELPRDEALRVALCNTPVADADRIADALVREGLAACVNIVPAVRSVYVWDGAVQHDEESTLLIKTTAAAMPALTARILALHPYELPEVIALPLDMDHGNPAYHRWVAERVRR